MVENTAESPVWFVTGCSTGFGRAFVQAALAHGFRVAATARDIRQIEDLVAGQEGRARAFALDVTQPDQVAQAVAAAEQEFGRIDVLVNNAGYGYLGSVEEGEDSAVRAMFETNFFGLAAVIRAVLPGMRARRHGTIVNITSVAGLIGFAGSGYYAATKFAVEGLSSSLADEVEPLGIRVLAVEPGPFRTDWAGRSLMLAPETIADYAQTSGQRTQSISENSGHQIGDPVRAAEAVIAAVQAPNPPRHLVLGRFGVEQVERRLQATLQEVESWAATSLGADYPAAGA